MQRSVCLEGLLHFDRRDKAIALAVQRAQEARRASVVPQCLAQCRNTGCQRRISDKLIRPQVREEFLLGDYSMAMDQKILKYLKDSAPQLTPTTPALSTWSSLCQELGG